MIRSTRSFRFSRISRSSMIKVPSRPVSRWPCFSTTIMILQLRHDFRTQLRRRDARIQGHGKTALAAVEVDALVLLVEGLVNKRTDNRQPLPAAPGLIGAADALGKVLQLLPQQHAIGVVEKLAFILFVHVEALTSGRCGTRPIADEHPGLLSRGRRIGPQNVIAGFAFQEIDILSEFVIHLLYNASVPIIEMHPPDQLGSLSSPRRTAAVVLKSRRRMPEPAVIPLGIAVVTYPLFQDWRRT